MGIVTSSIVPLVALGSILWSSSLLLPSPMASILDGFNSLMKSSDCGDLTILLDGTNELRPDSRPRTWM